MLQLLQGGMLPRVPERGNIIVAPDGDDLASNSLHRLKYLVSHDVTGMHGDITIGQDIQDTAVEKTMRVGDDADTDC